MNWRDFKESHWSGYPDYMEVEKYMIYVQAEEFLEGLDDELVEAILDAAMNLRQNIDYMSVIGCGQALYQLLYFFYDDMEQAFSGADHKVVDARYEEVVANLVEIWSKEELRAIIVDEWVGAEWQ